VEDAVKQIYEILDNPERYQQLSKAAIDRVQQHFAIQKVSNEYFQLLNDICQNSQSPEGKENHL
jgi:glycosyltransferase involved in cell wall biosynthesis